MTDVTMIRWTQTGTDTLDLAAGDTAAQEVTLYAHGRPVDLTDATVELSLRNSGYWRGADYDLPNSGWYAPSTTAPDNIELEAASVTPDADQTENKGVAVWSPSGTVAPGPYSFQFKITFDGGAVARCPKQLGEGLVRVHPSIV